LEPGELAFELGEARVEPLESRAHFWFQIYAIRAVMARGGAAFDGVIKLLPARTAGARALAGGGWGGHGYLGKRLGFAAKVQRGK
jgi:hypothetical protein